MPVQLCTWEKKKKKNMVSCQETNGLRGATSACVVLFGTWPGRASVAPFTLQPSDRAFDPPLPPLVSQMCSVLKGHMAERGEETWLMSEVVTMAKLHLRRHLNPVPAAGFHQLTDAQDNVELKRPDQRQLSL